MIHAYRKSPAFCSKSTLKAGFLTMVYRDNENNILVGRGREGEWKGHGREMEGEWKGNGREMGVEVQWGIKNLIRT